MLDRFVQSVLDLAALVAAWFVPPGTHLFGLLQMGAALLLITALIASVAVVRHARGRRKREREKSRL